MFLFKESYTPGAGLWECVVTFKLKNQVTAIANDRNIGLLKGDTYRPGGLS